MSKINGQNIDQLIVPPSKQNRPQSTAPNLMRMRKTNGQKINQLIVPPSKQNRPPSPAPNLLRMRKTIVTALIS
jgi:hypothetical protein